MTLTGRVALVTGASRGFGSAAARAFAAAGAHVVALARTAGGLEELDDLIQAAGGQATLVPLDISDGDGLARMGAAIHGRWGKLDLWLHTAAFAPHLTPIDRADGKDFDRTFKTNVTAFQHLIRVVDPLLRPAEAPMALIAADQRAGEKFFGPYGASKAAQSALARSWAAEAPRLTVAEV
ncbi:MAG: SDR family oxidoreductase, partial [Pseudomonadota bacterium]